MSVRVKLCGARGMVMEGRMHVRLNDEPLDSLEEVDCFKYLGSQVAVDGGCDRNVVHRTNETYIERGES